MRTKRCRWGSSIKWWAKAEVLDATLEMAETLLLASPLALRASKAVMARAFDEDLRTAMLGHLGWPEILEMMASDDAREGTRSFAEKRAPVWQGR